MPLVPPSCPLHFHGTSSAPLCFCSPSPAATTTENNRSPGFSSLTPMPRVPNRTTDELRAFVVVALTADSIIKAAQRVIISSRGDAPGAQRGTDCVSFTTSFINCHLRINNNTSQCIVENQVGIIENIFHKHYRQKMQLLSSGPVVLLRPSVVEDRPDASLGEARLLIVRLLDSMIVERSRDRDGC